ncbi:MAG: hypothetical protein RLZZ182_1145 [Pseudomonadota bacterium]
MVQAPIKAAILTFHNTPNYGATLQCLALHNHLTEQGCKVEVINYMPTHALLQYAKSLFLGKRRSLKNLQRVYRFYTFVRDHIALSGAPIFRAGRLKMLQAKHYQIAFSGSDEVWKVDHMRPFDPSYYFSFLDPSATRLVAYAATSSTVTDLTGMAVTVTPLLRRFSGLGIRDRSTASMVERLLGQPPEQVLDPTLIWDFTQMDLPPMRTRPYLAVYSWLSDADMLATREFAQRHGLEVVCVGCRHALADANLIGIGPHEWLRLMKHASAVLTDFFHGVLFSIIFHRPFYAHVDAKKRMKLEQALQWVGLGHHLHETAGAIRQTSWQELEADWVEVDRQLARQRMQSQAFIREQLARCQA